MVGLAALVVVAVVFLMVWRSVREAGPEVDRKVAEIHGQPELEAAPKSPSEPRSAVPEPVIAAEVSQPSQTKKSGVTPGVLIFCVLVTYVAGKYVADPIQELASNTWPWGALLLLAVAIGFLISRASKSASDEREVKVTVIANVEAAKVARIDTLEAELRELKAKLEAKEGSVKE